LYNQYRDQGLTVITLLGENNSSQTPSQSELMQWANSYGITHPVVADGDMNGDGYNFDETINYLFASPDFDGSFFLPNMQLLAPGLVVQASNTIVSEQQIVNVLP
jgi:hypothetical protein